MPPSKFTSRFIKKEKFSAKCYKLDFELVDGTLDFKAGQYMSVIVSDKIRRSYSIYSSPLDSQKEFSLLVDMSVNGPGTNYLRNLNPRDEINAIGPLGHFVLPDVLCENLYFIATGSGIAPIDSMIETLIKQKSKSNMYLYFGTSHNSNVIEYEKYSNYHQKGYLKEYVIAISREDPTFSNSINGKVSDIINSKKLPNDSQFFVCGSGSMTDSVVELLLSKGINESDIFYEKFFS
jgi:CDP-4-dehydro-6-deoxyglucose reductase, E3